MALFRDGSADVSPEVKDDLTIRRRILDEISNKPWAPHGTVDVIVRQGVVESKEQ